MTPTPLPDTCSSALPGDIISDRATRLISLADVENAARNIGPSIIRTPFLLSQTLSDLTGAEIWLKFENLQFTASFKERGALNRLTTLTPEQARRGVVAVSAGNHAQGVALHARRLGIPATIVMPLSTPRIKIARTEGFGAKILLAGANFAEASLHLSDLIEREGLTLVHPFSDPLVIAGQGTVGLEMIDDGPDMDVVVIAVGGGGLIGGVGTVFAARSPSTEIIGVQSELYPSMALALGSIADRKVRGGTSVAEGIAVATADALTLLHARNLVNDMIIVPEKLIEDSIALLLQIEKTMCEGAGAAGLAAVLAEPERFRGKRVGLILSGGNIDTRVLISVLQRHLARGGQLVRLTINALDNAGGLGAIATIIGAGGGNILDVHHDRVFGGATARAADVAIDLELADPEELSSIIRNIRNAGFPVSIAPPSH
jgi:threonine dehydratase